MGAHDVPPLRSPHQGTRRLSLLPILHPGGILQGTDTAQPGLCSIISITSYASLAMSDGKAARSYVPWLWHRNVQAGDGSWTWMSDEWEIAIGHTARVRGGCEEG